LKDKNYIRQHINYHLNRSTLVLPYIRIMKTVLVITGVICSATAFAPSCFPHLAHIGRSSLNMGGATGYASTLDGKKEKVEIVKNLIDSSEFVFSIPGDTLTVSQVQTLRRSLPETSTMTMIKNKLMARACTGTKYEEPTKSLLKGSNMWFFIEDDLGGTVKALKAFTKEADKKETHMILGGIVDGIQYDSKGIEAISNLPSKLELISQIAGSIKAVPTKVARVIKEPGNKLARAIKLATTEESEE